MGDMILDFRPDKSKPLPSSDVRTKAHFIFEKNQPYSQTMQASGELKRGPMKIELYSITAHPGTATTLTVNYQDREVMRIVYFNGMEREIHSYVPGEWEDLFVALE
jgi:hypothetical protein